MMMFLQIVLVRSVVDRKHKLSFSFKIRYGNNLFSNLRAEFVKDGCEGAKVEQKPFAQLVACCFIARSFVRHFAR